MTMNPRCSKSGSPLCCQSSPRFPVRLPREWTRGLVRWSIFAFFSVFAVACDSGGSPDEEKRALNPDDIDIILQAISGTTRDEIKATMTSNSELALELVGITVFFHDAGDTQIGQLPFVFIGDFRRGDTAEQQFGLPAGIEKHDRYECYRYRIGLTGDGVSANAMYDGTCAS